MGVWDSYCVICGCGANADGMKKDDYFEDQPEFQKKRDLLKKEDCDWLEELYLLTNTNNLVKATRDQYDEGGRYIVEKETKDSAKQKYTASQLVSPKDFTIYETSYRNWHDSQYGNWGKNYDPNKTTTDRDWYSNYYALVVHKDCYKFIIQEFKFYLLFGHLSDMIDSRRDTFNSSIYGILKNVVGSQDFWIFFMENNILMDYMESPLKNKKNAKRIKEIWIPIIKKLKKNKLRPSPSEHASTPRIKVGDHGYGNDGNIYIVKKSKGIKKWVKKEKKEKK